MDIWNWVERLKTELVDAGHAHGADVIDRLSMHVCDYEHARADALAPEARALCKTLDNRWLEVFVRHWELRNRLGAKGEGESALREAVALFEFAHREDTIDCPQSICATQDLAGCYANVDGPGWVAERIAVSEETLARIDPSWTCYECLSSEKAEALVDDGRAEEALTFLEQQMRNMQEAGQDVSEALTGIRVGALIALGRHVEALDIITEIEARSEGPGWANVEQPRNLQKALLLALLERDEEAWAVLPPIGEVVPQLQNDWLAAARVLLARAPERNTWALGSALQQMLEHDSRHGAHRRVVNAARDCVELALQRGASWTARRHLAVAWPHVERLRADLGARAMLTALQAEVDAASGEQVLPAAPEALLDWLAEQAGDERPRDPEQEVAWLLQALKARPEDEALRAMAVSALQACAAHEDAIALLWEHVERHTDSEQNLAYELLGTLLERGAHDQVERLVALYADTVPVCAHWCRARLAERLGDWPAAEGHCRALLEISPASTGAAMLLARSLMAQQRFADAAACYKHLSTTQEDPKPALWDYLTAASAAGDWAGVREVAQTFEMSLSGDSGPIEEDWGWVIVRVFDQGDALDYYAQRTGPVTARIMENAPFNRDQCVGDLVVFDASALYPAPEDEEARRQFVPTFAVVHVLERGGFASSWPVDGVDPGEEAFESLRAALLERGWRIWVHSNSHYRVTDDGDPGAPELPGLFFSVALPEAVPPVELDRLLNEQTRDWAHRLCWLRLAHACGTDLTPHEAVIERYRL
ncbi:MAG: tetratricopeptide repeat protein [Rhodocyclaceae bacterium]